MVHRCRIWCTADRAGPVAARNWPACAAASLHATHRLAGLSGDAHRRDRKRDQSAGGRKLSSSSSAKSQEANVRGQQMKFTQIALWTGAVIVLSAQCAAAAPALATTDVNLRQGPGTNYPIIGTIPGGSTVDVGGCQGQWCSVVWQGRSGFAIATSLDQGAGPPHGGPPLPPGAGGYPPPGNEGPPPYGAGGPPPGPGGPPPYGAGGPSGPGGIPPPGATAEAPVPAYPPGAQPPPPGYYGPPPPGYYGPPPGYYDPYYYGPYYGPYWRRRYW